MHDDTYIGGRSENNIKFVVHDDLGWKNQTRLFCRVTGFMSDFLSFIDVELNIRFFHTAIQLLHMYKFNETAEGCGDFNVCRMP